MATPFVQSIDMTDFQILNFVVHSAGTSPTNSGGAGGMMWWDSTNYALKVYNDNDAAWNPVTQGPTSTTDGYVPTWSGTIGAKLGTGYQVLTTVGNPGVDTAIVTDQGIREAISAAISGGVTYKGGYNASTNTPDLETPAGGAVDQGDMYTVTVAGDFFTDTLAVGDVLIAENDDPSTLAEWTIVAREWDETFLELGDTPSAYTGAGGYMVMVDSTPDALEFVNPSTYNLSNFNNDLYTASALTKTDDTNVTLTLGGTPATALLQATSLTLGWTGTLAATRGGTGHGTYVVGDLLYASTTSALSRLAAVPAGSFLRAAGTSTAPAWSTMTIPNTILQDSILVANAADTLVALQVSNGQSIRLNAGGTAWEAFTPSSGIGNHNLLNSTEHPDTATAAVSRGSIIYGNSTPAWDELVIGTAGYQLQSDGVDISWSADITMSAGGAIQTGTTLADTLLIRAYDTDGTSYTTFGTLTAGTTPTFDLSTSVTVGSNAIAYAGGAFHDGFSDFVGNEHIDHTSVTITAGSGLSYSTGGTDISASATIDLDINSLTTETAIAAGDFVPFWDITATATNKKITFANFEGDLNHDNLLNFVADEHVDHTAVTITAGSGLSYSVGGTDISASATIDLDINSLSTETTIADGDFVPFWDITATATNKKITFANFVTEVEASLDLSGYATVVSGDLGSGASPTITHNLNKTEITDIVVQIWRQSDNKLVSVEITAATLDTVTVSFGSAAINPTLGTFRYVVTGVQE